MFNWREFWHSLNWYEGFLGLVIGIVIIGTGLGLGLLVTLLFPDLGPAFWSLLR